jgi:hypothetical protein
MKITFLLTPNKKTLLKKSKQLTLIIDSINVSHFKLLFKKQKKK